MLDITAVAAAVEENVFDGYIIMNKPNLYYGP